MGAAPSGLQPRPSGLLPESYVGELGTGVLYERALGSSRLFKAIRARTRHGRWVVKVYVKPDPSFSLKSYIKRVRLLRDALHDIPNVFSYQQALETEKAAYLIRQWVASNLYDRISTRPFLTLVEKKWIAFQLLCGLRDAHQRNIRHGDIKTENILVTSANWAFLSDFASYKPVYLPEDDPSDFSVFFDASGRRTCCLAPERFLPTSSPRDPNALLTEAMDVFSLGCVIAEMFVENSELFTLSQLLRYRSGEWQPDSFLSKIEDHDIRNLINSMISLSPDERLSADKYLETYRDSAFPSSFYTFFHPFFQNINHIPAQPFPSSSSYQQQQQQQQQQQSNLTTTNTLGSSGTSTPSQAATTAMATNPFINNTTGNYAYASSLSNSSAPFGSLPTNADERIERIWGDFENVIEAFGDEDSNDSRNDGNGNGIDNNNNQFPTPNTDIFPVTLSIPGYETTLPTGPYPTEVREDGPAVMILSLVCSNMRNCTKPSSILRAFDLCLALSKYLTDETKLDRLLPYLVSFLDDDVAIVRASALRSITQLCMVVNSITPSNTSVFPEYILPHLRPAMFDTEIIVRCFLAKCLPYLASTASRYLDLTQQMKMSGTFKVVSRDYPDTLQPPPHLPQQQSSSSAANITPETTYEVSLAELIDVFQAPLDALLTDPSPMVKLSLLEGITTLCVFLGKTKTNDVILSHMITYLNDSSYILREKFFHASVGVSTCIGSKSMEEFIFPLMIQALADREECVTTRVITSLTTLLDLGLLSKSKVWEVLYNIIPLICHPSTWIRKSSADFVAHAANWLSEPDTHCILYPALRRLLRSDISTISQDEILNASLAPLSRILFEANITWAIKPGKSLFWKQSSANGNGNGNGNSGNGTISSPSSSSSPTIAYGRVNTPVTPNNASQFNIPIALLKYPKDRKTLSSCAARSDEDAAQIERLRQLGLTSADSLKVELLRDHIIKIASSRERQRITSYIEQQSLKNNNETSSNAADRETTVKDSSSPPNYGVIPQTILYSRTNDDTTAQAVVNRLHQSDSSTSLQAAITARRYSSSLRPLRTSFGGGGSSISGMTTAGSSTAGNSDDLRKRLALRSGGSSSSLTSINTSSVSPVETITSNNNFPVPPATATTTTSTTTATSPPHLDRRSLSATSDSAAPDFARAATSSSPVPSDTASAPFQFNIQDIAVSTTTATSSSSSAATVLPPTAVTSASNTTATATVAPSSSSSSSAATALNSSATSTVKKRSRVNVNGVDVGRVAPAIAQDSTTAIGVINSALPLQQPMRALSVDGGRSSGASTPVFGNRFMSSSNTPQYMLPPFTSTYDGSDPNILQYLERVFLDSYREPAPDFGRFVPNGPPRRRLIRSAAGGAGRGPTSRGDRRVLSSHSPSANNASSSRPDGTLIAHLAEHTGRINSITVSPDQVFFASGSDDGTVKIWDTARVEKNVSSKSRQTLRQGGKITTVAMLENTHCVASASTNGTIMIHRVDVVSNSGPGASSNNPGNANPSGPSSTSSSPSLPSAVPKYGKQQLIRKYTFDSDEFVLAMTHYETETQHSRLLCATSLSHIIIFDVKSMSIQQTLKQPNHLGHVTTLLVDRKRVWLVTGTSNGYMTFWDLRFGILLRTWRVGAGDDNRKVTSCILHPMRGRGRWIMVASEPKNAYLSSMKNSRRGSNESESSSGPTNLLIETWNIEDGSLVEVFATRPLSDLSGKSSVSNQSNKATSTTALHTDVSPEGNAQISKLLARNKADSHQNDKKLLDPASALEKLLSGSLSSSSSSTTDIIPDLSHLEPGSMFLPSHVSAIGVNAMVGGFEYYPTDVISGGRSISMQHLYHQSHHDSRKSYGESSVLGEAAAPSESSNPSAGFLITGGEDRKLRFWNLSHPDRSVVFCGSDLDLPKSVYKRFSSTHGKNVNTTAYIEYQQEERTNASSNGTDRSSVGSATSGSGPGTPIPSHHQQNSSKLHRSTLIAQHQQHLLRAHQDAITAIVLLDYPFRCVVSGDRSGVIKIFE